MKKIFILSVLFLVFLKGAFSSPFKYKIHADKIYILSSDNKKVRFNSKELPKDVIKIRNFESPVHIYMKITLESEGKKYESEIFVYYGNDTLRNSYQKDIQDIIESMCKENNLDTGKEIAVDIQFVSKEISQEKCKVFLEHNDVIIVNTEVPNDIPSLFE
ncbi:MAG: hypothetical protein K6E69_00150 [Treponema sp.]|uniref:hypothetical protein n=1 Tax=Treponema sp. TaxID=166 RepID=UPI00298E6CE4|nr:hypothetical protein [Treponema sp.]MCR5385512.1 hypothetical protein [Treponema sp.]